MKWLILSDSHSKFITKEILEGYDYIFHAGDISLKDSTLLNSYANAYLVKGNCDMGLNNPKEKIILIDGIKILLLHSDKFDTKYGLLSLKKYAKSIGAKVCIFGHTHEPYFEVEDNILYLNPGSYMWGSHFVIEDDELYHYNLNNIKKYKLNFFR